MTKLLKNIFSSLFFVYKNVFHWIISKILIILSTFLTGILISLPLLLIIILIIYLSPLTLSNFLLSSDNILGEFLLNKGWFILVAVLFLINIFIFVSTINYKRILLAKLNFKYIDNKKLKFNKNEYFNINLLVKNIKIYFINISIIIFISLIFILLLLFLVNIYGGITNINNSMSINSINSFSIISLLLAILYLIITFYILYRVYFSLYILLENEDYTAINCIKKSIKKTDKKIKVFKLICILFVFFVVLLPVNYFGQYLEFNKNNLEYYIDIKNKKILKQEISEKENMDFSILDTKYGKINNKELVDKYNKNSIINMIYLILHFLLIFGIYDLVLANFYKTEIK